MVSVFSSSPFYMKYITSNLGKFHWRFGTIPSFSHISVIQLAPLVAATYPSPPPSHLHSGFQNHKGFLSQNRLFVCNFNLNFIYCTWVWDGKDQPLMLTSIIIQSQATPISLPINICLQIQAIHFKPSFLFHIKMCDISWLNGVMQVSGMSFILCWLFLISTCSPSNREEFFNLCHASAHNITK